MLKIKVTHSFTAIVFILLMNNLSNPVKATDTDNKYEENTLRQRLTPVTNDPQRVLVQLELIQPPQHSWKAWALGGLIVVSGITCLGIVVYDYMHPYCYLPKFSGGGGASGGGSGVSW